MATGYVEYGSKGVTFRLVDNSQMTATAATYCYGATHLLIKPGQKVRYTVTGQTQKTLQAGTNTISVALPASVVAYRY